MSSKPPQMSNEEFEAHVAESKRVTKERRDIEENPTDVALDHERRLAAIEEHVFGADQADEEPEAAPTPPPPVAKPTPKPVVRKARR